METHLKPAKEILLVEDDAGDAELTVAALETNGAEGITVVRDGVQALDYIHRREEFAARAAGQPALILLDLKMPKLSGPEVLRQLKANPETRSIPVVILSSSREPRDLELCYQIGANAYVVKPVEYQQFVETVRVLRQFWLTMNELPSMKQTPIQPLGQA